MPKKAAPISDLLGKKAPAFTAVTDTGDKVKLSDFAGKRVILFFYPKDMTPGCTTQACGFRDRHDEVTEVDAVVLGVSPDGVAKHEKFRSKYDLPFNLLVDEDHKIAEKYGAWGEKSMYGRKYMGIIRSHFVIDEQGKVIDAQIKISPKDSVKKAIEALAS